MRGSSSCTHLQAGAAGRSRISDGVTGQLGGLVRTLLGHRGARWWSWWWGSSPYFTPVTRSDQRCWCSLCVRVRAYVCMRLKVSDSGIPAILVNHADRRLRIPPVHHSPAVNAYTCTYILIHSRLTCKLYYLAAFEDKNRTHCWFTGHKCASELFSALPGSELWTTVQNLHEPNETVALQKIRFAATSGWKENDSPESIPGSM